MVGVVWSGCRDRYFPLRERRRAAQLAAEADKPPNAAPAGRAGWFSARRTASRRLQTLNVNTVCSAASGAPLVRSRVCAACSLTSDPLGAPTTWLWLVPPPAALLHPL